LLVVVETKPIVDAFTYLFTCVCFVITLKYASLESSPVEVKVASILKNIPNQRLVIDMRITAAAVMTMTTTMMMTMMTTITMMALVSDPMQGMAVIMEVALKYVLLTH
jgi:hypothetical protein